MAQVNLTLSQEEILDLLQKDQSKAFQELLRSSLQSIVDMESDEILQAKPYERSGKRTDRRNGRRERPIFTKVGTIILEVPRHRDQPFHSLVFDRYQRCETALMVTMAEMVVAGVSTRKVSKVMEALCGKSFSKSSVSKACEMLDEEIVKFKNRPLKGNYPFVLVDATYFKVREEGRVTSKALFIAMAMNEQGIEEILDFGIYPEESRANWNHFFIQLKQRGVKGVRMVTSDAHEGILYAMKEQFPDTPWQRCHYHFTKNIVEKAPKSYQLGLRADLRAMFSAPDLAMATKKMNQIAQNYRDVAEGAVACLEEGFLDAMTNLLLPQKIRTYVRTSNHVERLNRELKRRSNVIGIFPNQGSLLRLMGAVLIQEHESWSSHSRRFYQPTYREIEACEEKLKELAHDQQRLLKSR